MYPLDKPTCPADPNCAILPGMIHAKSVRGALLFRFAREVGEVRGDVEGPVLFGELGEVEKLARLGPVGRGEGEPRGALPVREDADDVAQVGDRSAKPR